MTLSDARHFDHTEVKRQDGAADPRDKPTETLQGGGEDSPKDAGGLSRFETILTTYPPILEALLPHLPTLSVLDLYHTSGHLRRFFRSYPLAWQNLSFRQLPHDLHTYVPVSDSQGPEGDRGSGRPNALDLLLRSFLPFGTCLTRLDLDNTAVSGSELYSRVLDGRRRTLQHLSVRNCKNVSLKYHILPYLHMQVSLPSDCLGESPLALKSLYTYRCRHHRRRPYLPASLSRRDSDSHPTHQLIQTCYYLGIWTDTGWCTTPGPRCFRRRDYSLGRVAADSQAEIWVPFDRLWRSQNFIGRCDNLSVLENQESKTYGVDSSSSLATSGSTRYLRLWEEREHGHCGEALGSGISTLGEGKELPTHLRRSHTTFIEGFRCHACGLKIQERCEQCSIRMHCVGCRRTLCASCAFNKPLQIKRQKKNIVKNILQAIDALGSADVFPPIAGGDIERKMFRRAGTKLWWAPRVTRSPNNISEPTDDEAASGLGQDAGLNQTGIPERPPETKITTGWCCQRFDFSIGGSATFPNGAAFPGNWQDGTNIRAAPLPMGQGFEDPAFPNAMHIEDASGEPGAASTPDEHADDDGYPPRVWLPPDAGTLPGQVKHLRRTRKVEPFRTIPYIERAARDGPCSYSTKTFPRNLCKQCFESPKWKVRCAFKDCDVSLCIEHDIKTLQVRQCGFQKLETERRALRYARPLRVFYAKWKPVALEMQKHDFSRERNTSVRDARTREDSTWVDSAWSRSGHVRSLTVPIAPVGDTSTQLSRLWKAQKHPRARSMSIGRDRTPTRSSENSSLAGNYSCDDSSLSAPNLTVAKLNFTPLVTTSRFTGCSRLFCLGPDGRRYSDMRPPCPSWEYLQKCVECGIYACFDCCGLEMGCTCSACLVSPRKALCPACKGDWEIGLAVKKTTEELVSRGEKWKLQDRGKRFWRCRIEEESKPWRDVGDEDKTNEEVERARKELFRELPGLDCDDDDVYDAGDGLFGVLEGSHFAFDLAPLAPLAHV